MKTERAFFATLILTALLSGPAVSLEHGWVISSDYTSLSRIQGVSLSTPISVSQDLGTLPSDAVGRWYDGLVYIVGRGVANLIQVYDPADGFSLVREFSLGSGLNPQDIVFDTGDEAYVTCYDAAVLLRINVVTGTVLSTYSTAAFADADGLPETAWMLRVDDRLFITCQRLDRNSFYSPTGPGQLLVFDLVERRWVDLDDQQVGIQPLQLVGANPHTKLEVHSDDIQGITLRVGCSGYYGLTDGGVEEVDLATLQSNGFLVGESTLSGDLIDFLSTDNNTVYCLIADAMFHTSVRRVDLVTGQVTVIHQAGDYVHADLDWDGDFQLLVTDRTLGNAGLRVFDSNSGAELTVGPVPTVLAPSQIILPSESVSPVPQGSPLISTFGALRLSAPWPNPCNPAADMTISADPGQSVQISVVDVRGRRVAVKDLVVDGSGTAQYCFTGQDPSGRTLPAGVYRLVAQSQQDVAACSVVLVK